MIYVITCYYTKSKDKMKNKTFSHDDFLRTREWGYFFKKETVLRYIKENLTDIYENGYYNLACIEERHPGICSSDNKFWWYNVEYINQDEYEVEQIREEFMPDYYNYGFQKDDL